MIKKLIFYILTTTFSLSAFADNGYNLWLNYKLVEDVSLLANYRTQLQSLYIPYQNATAKIAASELENALKILLNERVAETKEIKENSLVLLKTEDFTKYGLASKSFEKTDAFAIEKKMIQNKPVILISSPSEIGLLYGSFKLLQILGTNGDISQINIQESPKIARRILNHWDNLDRTVERGYAGFSLWDWQRLPKYIDQRYIDYARANASIGINGTVLTNVNSNALILTKEWLQKVKALADTFRPYGIRVYLTARFSAPIEIGKLKTS